MSVQVQVMSMIVSALRADTALTSQLITYSTTNGVFTHVAQGFDDYPYVVLYDIDLNGDDNDITLAFDGVFNLHSWSDSLDFAVIGNIQKAIYNALHRANLTMTDYDLIDMYQENQITLRDPDGITLHGVQRFRIILQNKEA